MWPNFCEFSFSFCYLFNEFLISIHALHETSYLKILVILVCKVLMFLSWCLSGFLMINPSRSKLWLRMEVGFYALSVAPCKSSSKRGCYARGTILEKKRNTFEEAWCSASIFSWQSSALIPNPIENQLSVEAFSSHRLCPQQYVNVA